MHNMQKNENVKPITLSYDLAIAGASNSPNIIHLLFK